MKRIPQRRQTASVPPTVVAPMAPCATHGREVARPGLERVGACLAEALELVAVEPDDDGAVEHTDRCGHGPFGPDRRLRREAHLHPHPGWEPVCDRA